MFGIGEKKDKEKKEINKTEDIKSNDSNTMFGRDFIKQECIADVKPETEQQPPQNTQSIPKPLIKDIIPAPKAPPINMAPQPPLNSTENTLLVKPDMQTNPPKLNSMGAGVLPELPKMQKSQKIPPNVESKLQTDNFLINKSTTTKTTRPFTDAKGPVFVSVKRYKDLMTALNNLKSTASNLRQIMSDLKQNRDTGTKQLSKTADALSSLETDIEKVNASIKA